MEVIPYKAFRTGMTFKMVRRMLKSPSNDPSTWRHITRHTVLGKWHQWKLEMYDDYLNRLDAINEIKAAI